MMMIFIHANTTPGMLLFYLFRFLLHPPKRTPLCPQVIEEVTVPYWAAEHMQDVKADHPTGRGRALICYPQRYEEMTHV